jgi:hypothetical protein
VLKGLTAASQILKWWALILVVVSAVVLVAVMAIGPDSEFKTVAFIAGLGAGGLAVIVALAAFAATVGAWITRQVTAGEAAAPFDH